MMKTNSIKEKFTVLMDIGYSNCINTFESEYGFSVEYSEIEQESYIELKQMVFETVDRDIKFRKHGRLEMTLIVASEMSNEEYEKFKEFYKSNFYKFTHDFRLKNIRKINLKKYE